MPMKKKAERAPAQAPMRSVKSVDTVAPAKLDREQSPTARELKRRALESWENEGGAQIDMS